MSLTASRFLHLVHGWLPYGSIQPHRGVHVAAEASRGLDPGRVAREALSHGVPVIASRHSALEKLFVKENGRGGIVAEVA